MFSEDEYTKLELFAKKRANEIIPQLETFGEKEYNDCHINVNILGYTSRNIDGFVDWYIQSYIEGYFEGKEARAKQIAINLLNDNVSINIINSSIGLTEEEILALPCK